MLPAIWQNYVLIQTKIGVEIMYCFNCEKDVNGDEKTFCKNNHHDLDVDHIHASLPNERDVQSNEEETETTKVKPHEKLISFAINQIVKVIVSKNDSNRVIALIRVKDHLETLDLDTKYATDWLKTSFYSNCGELFPEEKYKSVIDLIKAQARFASVPREQIYKRIAFVCDEIWYDLCNQNWEIVRINKDSVRIVKPGENTPIFHRSANQSEQATPCFSFHGNPLDDFCKLVRMDSLLFKIHLITLFIENVPTPLMVILGQQGSIKSTLSGLIKRIIDPAGEKTDDNLSHFPKSIDDLNIHLFHNQLCSFDNVSYISNDVSDVLCKAITGAGYPKRKYYTDNEEIILKFQRKIILNGITANIDYGDLAERSIQYLTQRIPEDQRLTSDEVELQFKSMLMDLLGQIFITLQGAMRIHDEVKSEITHRTRMADFEIWGEAISRDLGYDKGVFLEEYRKAIKDSNELLAENIPIIQFLEEKLAGIQEYTNTVATFLKEFRIFVESLHYDVKGMPTAPSKLRPYLRKWNPLLQEYGLNIELEKNTKNNSFTKGSVLVRVRKVSSPASPVSPLYKFTRVQSEPSEASEPTNHDFENGGDSNVKLL